MIELTIRKPGEAERRVILAGGVYRMGRQEDNEILLADKEVSRHHARLLVDRDTIVVEDLGGGNGTWVSGDRVTRKVLRSGDEIEILPFMLTVRTGAKAVPRKVAVVRIVEGKGKGSRVVLEGDHVTLGRGADQDVRLDDHGASRAHATLSKRGGTWFVRDLDSSNGVLLNDQRVMEAPVETGDTITIGDTVLRFDVEAEDPSASAYDADAVLDDEPTAAEGPAPRVAARPAPPTIVPPPTYAPPPAQAAPAPTAVPAYAPPAPPPVQTAPVQTAPRPLQPAPQGAGMTPLIVLGVLFLAVAFLMTVGLIALWST